MNFTYEEIKFQAQTAAEELVEAARLQKGDILAGKIAGIQQLYAKKPEIQGISPAFFYTDVN